MGFATLYLSYQSHPVQDRARAGLLSQLAHDLDQVGFALEADARQIRHDDVAVFDANGVREAAVWLKQVGVALIAAEAQASRNVQRHLVPAMGDAAGRRPAMLRQNIERPKIFDKPVRQGAVEL